MTISSLIVMVPAFLDTVAPVLGVKAEITEDLVLFPDAGVAVF